MSFKKAMWIFRFELAEMLRSMSLMLRPRTWRADVMKSAEGKLFLPLSGAEVFDEHN